MTEDLLFETTKCYHNEILSQSKKVVKLLGTYKIIHIDIDGSDNVLMCCSDIKWLENSISKKYYKINRGLTIARDIDFQFLCDVNEDNCSDSQKEMIADAKHSYNWHNNVAFCLPGHTNGSRSYMCFGSSKHNKDIYNKIFKNLNMAQSILLELVNNLNNLYNLSSQQPRVCLRDIIDNDINVITNTTKEKKQLEKKQFLNACSQEGEGDFLSDIPLNDLEKSFFRQYLSGCTSNISNILSSDEKFINDLKIKFACSNAKELGLTAEKLNFLGRI